MGPLLPVVLHVPSTFRAGMMGNGGAVHESLTMKGEARLRA